MRTLTNEANRRLIDRAAYEAAMASRDAHGKDHRIDSAGAYDFIRTAWYESEEAELPERQPAEFRHDYNRYVRLFREGLTPVVEDRTDMVRELIVLLDKRLADAAKDASEAVAAPSRNEAVGCICHLTERLEEVLAIHQTILALQKGSR